MSENNNNNDNKGFNTDDFAKQFNEFVNKTVKTVQGYGKIAADRVDTERQKAEVRSEIGHNSRDLSRAYEKLGHAYYDAKEANSELSGEADLFDVIRSKEKLIELLNEKLDGLEKE